jgi:pilus assembly protein CpaF
MKLGQRMREAKAQQAEPTALTNQRAERADAAITDPLATYKQRVQDALYEKLGPDAFIAERGDLALRRAVTDELRRLIDEDGAPLTTVEADIIAAEISEDILGLGPVQRYVNDPTVTEIMVNGLSPIFVEREGQLFETPSRFVDAGHLRRVIDRIVTLVGRRIDESSPMVDARLRDGSRVNAVIPPLAVDGDTLTIRKFAREPYRIADLIRFGTVTEPIADLLRICVEGRLNILITGGTGTGKTTMLNVVSSFIPETQRIITIEDAVELQLDQRHVVRLESRPPNIEGRGAVTIRDLVRNSLRMRPDRIVVGEVRGAESLDMLQAMNTGHEGSLSTLHANSPRDALSRLETMVLMAGLELPVAAIRDYIAAAISLIVHLSRMQDGSRRVTHITEVAGMEGAVITLQDLYRFDYSAPPAEGSQQRGRIRPTGIRPTFSGHLEELGFELPAELFDAPGQR